MAYSDRMWYYSSYHIKTTFENELGTDCMKEIPATVRSELVLCFVVQKYTEYKYKIYWAVNLSVPLGDCDP